MDFRQIALLSVLTVSTHFSMAADIYVEPGTGTLTTAINNAQSGDTLILTTGSYISANDQVIFSKPLTVRAESAETDAVVRASILTHSSLTEPLEYLRFQGIRITPPHWCFGAYGTKISVAKLELLEVKASCYDLGLYATEEVTVIGSELASIDSGLQVTTAKANIFGNKLNFGHGVNITAKDTDFIGNEVTTFEAMANIFQHSGSGNQLIAANRFNYRLTRTLTYNYIPADISSNQFSLLYSSAARNNPIVFKNNVFKIDLTNFNGFATSEVNPGIEDLYRIMVSYYHDENHYFYNNIFDMSGLTIVQPGSLLDDPGPMFDKTVGAFENNIVANYNETIFDEINAENVKYNLGFNNAGQFDTNNVNLNSNPLFNSDYSLATGSPAINKGSPKLYFSDIDRTRNDIGAYGGSWNIAQYDAQRADGAQGPFIYPTIEAQQGVANGELKVKFVSYPRLK